MKILFVHDANIQGDVIALALEATLAGCAVEQCESETQALELVQKNEGYASILASDKYDDGGDCLALFRWNLQQRAQIPFVLLTGTSIDRIPFFANHPVEAVVMRPINIADLVKTMGEVVAGPAAAHTNEEYVRVPIRSLVLLSSDLAMDFYIKLSDKKYVRAEQTGEAFTAADFNRYTAKGVWYLYARREAFLSRIDTWLKDLSASITAAPPGLEAASDRIAAGQAMVSQAFAAEKTFTPQLQAMTDASVELALETIQKNPTLSEITKSIRFDEIPYISSHSTLLALVSCRLAAIMGWATQATFYKLSLSAFLHDLSLEEDAWARLDTREEITESGLSAAIQAKILAHPRDSAALVEKAKGLPGEVSFIVEQHHEHADGSGFPTGITTKEISALTALFIVAHELADEVLRTKGQLDIRKFFLDEKFKAKFDRGSLSQVFRTIRQKLQENPALV